MQRLPSYINGRYAPVAAAPLIENINPATGELISHVEVALEPKSMPRSVRLQRAFGGGRRCPARNVAGYSSKRPIFCGREMANWPRLEVRDNGKPIQEAVVVDVASGADCIEYFAGVAGSLRGEQIALNNAFVYTRREPIGVCVGIGSWNYPLQIACWKSAPALACGNAMIFKTSELTPTTPAKLAEIYTEAGVPDGVFNVVHGDARTGSLLTTDPRVAKVSLTGSIGTGKKILAAAAASVKRMTMELSGKSALIVFPDADLHQAVSAAMLGNFYTQGEVCTNCTRVYVHADIHDQFFDLLIARTKKLRIGDPMAPETQVGALISRAHMDRVLGYIASGKAEGARLVYGGHRVDTAPLDKGNFVTPTIFTGCTDDMKIVREEIFGPVMSVLKFNDEDDVICPRQRHEVSASLPAFLHAISRAHIASPPGSRPASAGSTTTTSRRSRCRSAASRNPASATKTARPRSNTTRN